MQYKFSNDEREAFFDQNFEYGEDESNLSKANKIFIESYCSTSELAEMICNGEMVDEPTLVLELSKLLLADDFRKEMCTSNNILIPNVECSSPYKEEAIELLKK